MYSQPLELELYLVGPEMRVKLFDFYKLFFVYFGKNEESGRVVGWMRRSIELGYNPCVP